MQGKQLCSCDVGDVLDLEYGGERYVARVTKFEIYKSSRSLSGTTGCRDGELLVYISKYVTSNVMDIIFDMKIAEYIFFCRIY